MLKIKYFFILQQKYYTQTNIYLTITYFDYFRIQRDKIGSLGLHINTKAYFATKSPLSQQITTTLLIEHEMPSAGVQRVLEVRHYLYIFFDNNKKIYTAIIFH